MLVWQCHLSSRGLPPPILRAAWGNKHRHVGSNWQWVEYKYHYWKLLLGLARVMRSTDRGSMYPECPGKHPLLDKRVMSLARLVQPTQKQDHFSSLMCGKYLQGVYLHGNCLLEEYLHGRLRPIWKIPTREIPTLSFCLHAAIHLIPRVYITG